MEKWQNETRVEEPSRLWGSWGSACVLMAFRHQGAALHFDWKTVSQEGSPLKEHNIYVSKAKNQNISKHQKTNNTEPKLSLL